MKNIKKYLMVVIACAMMTGCMTDPYKAGIKSLEDGDYRNAAEEFQKAIEKEDNLADAYRGLGIALWEGKDYEGAYSALETALEQGTQETGTIYSLMGNCAMHTESYEKAVENYEIVLDRSDISDELRKETEHNLIAAYEYAGNIEKAKEYLAAYIEKYPEDENAAREAEFLETR